jgi:hypothetical protein
MARSVGTQGLLAVSAPGRSRASWVIPGRRLRGIRPVVDVANRIGHGRRPFRHRVSISGTRPGITAQGVVLFSMGPKTVQLRTSACMQLDPSVCPLFDRPKRGRKKPHQPALAHCVHVAGRDALRLTALLRVGATNRLSDSRHGPKVIPLRSPSAAQRRPRRRTAKGPKKNRSKKQRKAARRYRAPDRCPQALLSGIFTPPAFIPSVRP